MIAELLLDARGPEIRHRTGITAPDAFFYLCTPGRKGTVFFDAREYEIQKQRLTALGNGITIERLEPYLERAGTRSGALTREQKALLEILDDQKIDKLQVSSTLPFAWVKVLQDADIALTMKDFSLERRRKTEREIQEIIICQRITEQACSMIEDVLRKSIINDGVLMYEGKTLTSEWLKSETKKFFLEQNLSCPEGIIVASGDQTTRPHDDGSGPIKANEAIIIDLFPQSDMTGYCADMTRTFVKGRPSVALQRLVDAVGEVQLDIADFLDIGVTCDAVYARTVEGFKERGFETSPERGFMHRTGHALGLLIHEDPRFGSEFPDVIEPGMVFTVEPGLYYPGIGGVRIEDIVVFHPDGRKENITHYHKNFVIS